MKKTITRLAMLSGAVLLLAGCAPTAPPIAASPTPSAPVDADIVSPPAAFVQLDTAHAADRYLDLVCPNNLATRALADAFDAGEEEMLSGGDPDASAVRAAAARRLDLNRRTLTLLDDPFFRWPADVNDQVAQVRSSYLAELPTLDAMSNAASFSDAFYTTFAEASPEQRSAGQEIRYTLGIDADTVASCVGHETGIERLTAEHDERQTASE